MIEPGYEAVRVAVSDCGNGVYRIDGVEMGARTDEGVAATTVIEFFHDVLKCAQVRMGGVAQVAGWVGRVILEGERIWLVAWRE